MNIEYKISTITQGDRRTIVCYKINEYWETQIEVTSENQDDYPDGQIGDFITVPNRNLLQAMETRFNIKLSIEQINDYIHNVALNYGTVIN